MNKTENQRTCIFSREKKDKQQMIRIVKTKNDVVLVNSDEKGRGAYISKSIGDPQLILKRKLLNKVFRCEISKDIYEQLIKILEEEQHEKR